MSATAPLCAADIPWELAPLAPRRLPFGALRRLAREQPVLFAEAKSLRNIARMYQLLVSVGSEQNRILHATVINLKERRREQDERIAILQTVLSVYDPRQKPPYQSRRSRP